MRRLATLIGFVVPLAVAAQSQTVDEAPVFRLSVELVQVDAVVTDGKGSHVTTLGSEDFEVFQDGEPRAITAVVYVDADERWDPWVNVESQRRSRRVRKTHDERSLSSSTT